MNVRVVLLSPFALHGKAIDRGKAADFLFVTRLDSDKFHGAFDVGIFEKNFMSTIVDKLERGSKFLKRFVHVDLDVAIQYFGA